MNKHIDRQFILYSEREKLAKIYNSWVEKNGVWDCPASFVSFLFANELLNVEKALDFIKREDEKR